MQSVLFVSQRAIFRSVPRAMVSSALNSTSRSDMLALHRCRFRSGGLNLTAQKLVAALATLVALGAPAPGRAAVDRPPQFIVMAVDNCPGLERWHAPTALDGEFKTDGE